MAFTKSSGIGHDVAQCADGTTEQTALLRTSGSNDCCAGSGVKMYCRYAGVKKANQKQTGIDSFLFVLVLIGVVLSIPQKRAFFTENLVCPSNWTRFRDSCYYFETTKMRYDLAEVRCLEKGSTLFVADSMEEWLTVLSQTPPDYWSWIGLEQQDDEKQPRWTTPGGMNASEIDWLLSPRTSEMNGWNLIAKCVGYFHSSVISYAFFYYCGIGFNSICERNATLLANIWDESDRGF